MPVEPVEAAAEADAVDAVTQAGDIVVRGPLFGVAAQGAEDGGRWRVVVPVTAGCAQQARDSLNSALWFRAKDEARDRAERRSLLAAVARLESERVDELTANGTRYRVVRAEEYAGTGPDGIEQPRPTDPDPAEPDWSRGVRGPQIDEDLVLDPDAPVTPTGALEQLALRQLAYSGGRFPAQVIRDSRQALDTHPDVLLLPATFAVVERTTRGWKPVSGPHACPHEARTSLDFALTWAWPRMAGLIPVNTPTEADAHTLTAEAGSADPELREYAEASERLRAGRRLNRLEARGTVYRIGRTRRLLRWGPDGPEAPRPSDTDSHEPARIHLGLDEDGNVIPEE
ncbi:DUF5954 family protein [Streptomyces sp. NPDC047014]|uniref:DUF5954 family protein n=1 Tax=Streptomyces sp. NPDC047014 TaxID=3155736 RepID=UPI0033FFA178